MSLADILAAKRAAIRVPPVSEAASTPTTQPVALPTVVTAGGAAKPTGGTPPAAQGTALPAYVQAKLNGTAHEWNRLKPPTVAEVMSVHHTLAAAKADPILWGLLTLGRRIELTRLYTQKGRTPQPTEANHALTTPHNLTSGGTTGDIAEVSSAVITPSTLHKALVDAGVVGQEAKTERHEAFALSVVLNERQQLGADFAESGKSFVFTGPAGSGKTTGAREIVRRLLKKGFKPEEIAIVAYTNRATNNMRNSLFKDEELALALSGRVSTIHALLEFMPEFFPSPTDPTRTTMRFIPTRTRHNPLPLKVLVIEEASMLGLDLHALLLDALLPGIIIIFIGDIFQLQPPFGKSIMNYAMAQLPLVELTEVYRQALDSGVLANAHRVLKGELPVQNKDTVILSGKPGVKTGQSKLSMALAKSFNTWEEDGTYDPEQDIILSPWNKQEMGTTNLNNWIAQHMGVKRKAMVHEVLAGRNRPLYLAVGDKVMVDKQDGVITRIVHNQRYIGKSPQAAGTDLNRFGTRTISAEAAKHEDFDAMAEGLGYAALNVDDAELEEKKMQASHAVFVKLDGIDTEVQLIQVGDFSEQTFSLGYAITVHKAQGCEWRKVFLLLHEDHMQGGFLSRELLYTGITRAREKLVIVAKENVLQKAVSTQEVKGQTLQEKIAYINSGAQNIGEVEVVK